MDLAPIYTFTEQQVWAIAGAFILMLFDMVSGIIQAVMNREFRSSTIRTGLGHKAVLALIILLRSASKSLAPTLPVSASAE